jgi:hypothetical protein
MSRGARPAFSEDEPMVRIGMAVGVCVLTASLAAAGPLRPVSATGPVSEDGAGAPAAGPSCSVCAGCSSCGSCETKCGNKFINWLNCRRGCIKDKREVTPYYPPLYTFFECVDGPGYHNCHGHCGPAGQPVGHIVAKTTTESGVPVWKVTKPAGEATTVSAPVVVPAPAPLPALKPVKVETPAARVVEPVKTLTVTKPAAVVVAPKPAAEMAAPKPASERPLMRFMKSAPAAGEVRSTRPVVVSEKVELKPSPVPSSTWAPPNPAPVEDEHPISAAARKLTGAPAPEKKQPAPAATLPPATRTTTTTPAPAATTPVPAPRPASVSPYGNYPYLYPPVAPAAK